MNAFYYASSAAAYTSQYTGRDVEGVESCIDTRIQEWIRVIDQNWVSASGETKKYDLGRNIQFLTTDIICDLCFGRPLGFVKHQKDMHDFLKTLESRLPIVEQFSILTEVNTVLRVLSSSAWLKSCLIPSANDHAGVGRILRVCP